MDVLFLTLFAAIMAAVFGSVFLAMNFAVVNSGLMPLIRASLASRSAPVYITRKDGTEGKPNDVVFISTKFNDETLCSILLHVYGVANGTASAVSGAKPSDIVDSITVKTDKLIKIKADHFGAFRQVCQNILDKDWQEDTLGTNPSSVTYDAWIEIPISGRNAQIAEVLIDMSTIVKWYASGVTLTGLKTEYFACYSPIEAPEFSILSKSKTFSGVGTDDLNFTGDFASGFLEEMFLLGDGTIDVDDVEFKDKNGNSLISAKWDELIQFAKGRFQRTQATYGLQLRVVSHKPLEITDKLMLDLDMAGTMAMAGMLKNESTEYEPPAKAAKTPTKNEDQAPSKSNQPPKNNANQPGTPISGGSSGGFNVRDQVTKFFKG